MRYAIPLLLLALCAGFARADDLPNIVYILADDMGYGDIRALNPDSTLPTPNLDRLAADGMIFTDAHSPSAVCTPTRYGVLTGRYCWRSRLKRGVLNGYSPPLIEPDRPTVASFLSDAGYHTGIVGKWHLGLGFAAAASGKGFDFAQPVSDNPNTHGFRHSHIIPASLDFPPYVYIRNGTITAFPSLTQQAQKFPAYLRSGERSPDLVMADCLDDLRDQAIDYIGTRAKSDDPFFLYFPLTAPHKPVLPHPRFRGSTRLGPYGDFVTQVDATVGDVLNAIDTAGIRDNTLVIYTSDNGSFMYRQTGSDMPDHVSDETLQAYNETSHTANHVFRGTKADIWDAGHHVPYLTRWPARVKAGSRCDQPVCLTDLFATAAAITGQSVPAGAAPDSYSLLPLLTGASESIDRAPVIHHSSGGMFAIREGKWKLVLGNGSGGREKPRGKPFERPYHLFDVSTDVSERKNLIEQYPDVANKLEAKLDAIRDSAPND